MTQTVDLAEIRDELNTLVNQVSSKETRVVLERSGIAVAAIVSTEDLERLAQFDREHAERFGVIDRMREAFADVPAEEIEQETDRITAEIRETGKRKREGAAASR